MLGWEIIISVENDKPIAFWTTGIRGLDWIEKLVEKGLAQVLDGGGYPNRYKILAGSILPQLKEGALPNEQGSRFVGFDHIQSGAEYPPVFNSVKIDLLQDETPLIVEAWDQS